MDFAGKKRAGGQHHGAGFEGDVHRGFHAGYSVAVKQDVVHRLLEQVQIRLVFQHLADGGFVENAVGLGAGGAYRRAFAGV